MRHLCVVTATANGSPKKIDRRETFDGNIGNAHSWAWNDVLQIGRCNILYTDVTITISEICSGNNLLVETHGELNGPRCNN